MSTTTAGTTRPWTPNALRLTLAANAVAAVLLFLAWYGAAGEDTLQDGAVWANLAALGLLLAAYGNVRLLLIARHRIGLRHRVLRRSRRPERVPDVETDLRRVALPGGRLYHRPACRLVAGKPAAAVPAADPTALQPCGWCRP